MSNWLHTFKRKSDDFDMCNLSHNNDVDDNIFLNSTKKWFYKYSKVLSSLFSCSLLICLTAPWRADIVICITAKNYELFKTNLTQSSMWHWSRTFKISAKLYKTFYAKSNERYADVSEASAMDNIQSPFFWVVFDSNLYISTS